MQKTFKYKRQSRTKLILGSIVSLLFILFAIWAGWGWFILLPFVIDFYFIGLINWDFYRKIKNKSLRMVIGWAVDLLFAIIAVTFLNIYFFQNFIIPTSSLEKTLLVGDYLFVDKLTYGPRVPMTPLSIPLTHNTFMGKKSYSDWPHCKYHRLKGFRDIRRNDIVVFNFPAGDTVPTKVTNPDYYTLKHLYGRDAIWQNQDQFGEVIYRPVDKRDHYVKRCVALAGDTLEIEDNTLLINGEAQPFPKYVQHNYFVLVDAPGLSDEELDKLGISKADRESWIIRDTDKSKLTTLGLTPPESFESIFLYHFPLTKKMCELLNKDSRVRSITIEKANPEVAVYPVDYNNGWTRDNYGPIIIPARGMTIALNKNNLALYRRCIEAYEGHSITTDNQDKVLIDGKPSTQYTFAMNYYFMLGDNRHNSADSRFWGFVPEDHIVGTPSVIWLSIDKERTLFDGKIRFRRMFRVAK